MHISATILLAALLQVPTSAQVPCDDPGVDAWVVELRDRVTSFDRLARFAIERFGAPTDCQGSVTAEFDGAKFGTLTLQFSGDATFEVETFPPEASVVVLRAPAGLDEAEAAVDALRAYASAIGLAIDWENPESTMEGGERIESFWDRESGLNASASLIYADGMLVAVRLSMAL